MQERTKIEIIGGVNARIGRIGIVSNAKGAGKNLGKVEIYIDRKGHFWYDPKDLKVIEESPPKLEEEKFTVGFYDVDPNELKPHPANPQIYGEEEDLSDLIELISEFGIKERLIVNKRGEIISGNRRNRSAIVLKSPKVPIDVRAFKSKEEELELLLLKNATRDKTVFQKVREGQQWQGIEFEKAKERMRTAKVDNDRLTRSGVENFPQADEKGKVRDIIAKRVGLGSGKNYQKAVKVVAEIDRLRQLGKTDLALALEKILNWESINAAHKTLKMSDSDKEEILEAIANDENLTFKEAQKLLNQNKQETESDRSPETEKQLGEGVRVVVSLDSPICPGLKGEISSLPNKSQAIVLFADGTRQLIDRTDLEIAKENLPQKLTNLTKSPDAIPEKDSDNATEKPSTTSVSPKEPKAEPTQKTQDLKTTEFTSVEEELNAKQEEFGLGSGGNSVFPETDSLDELRHRNPEEVGDERVFANPPPAKINPKSLVNSLAIHAEDLGKDDYRNIGKIITKNKPDAIKDVAEMMADTEQKGKAIIDAIAKKYPHLLREEIF